MSQSYDRRRGWFLYNISLVQALFKESLRVDLQGFLAVRTGLEPATPGVTGRYSNQLNYRTKVQIISSRWRESNPRPRDYKSRALAN